MRQILFVGNIQFGEFPTGGGAQAKNQIFLNFLESKYKNVSFYDTWRKNKLLSLLIILFKIIFSPNKKIILSLTYHGVYVLSKVLTHLKLKRDIDYWVIGGDIAACIKDGRLDTREYFLCFKTIIVEAKYIADELKFFGITNVKIVPNFKSIPEVFVAFTKGSNMRFVYLARLIEEKGVGLIIEASRQLGEQDFEIDFYGSTSDQYTKEYFEELDLKNVNYKGFLNLDSKDGYAILASYDVLLFPTYFEGEGFPGVLIDAFICGLPVITTSFHANPEIVIDGKSGVIIPPHNIDELQKAMSGFIEGKYDLIEMKETARNSAGLYEVSNVLKDELFE
jgi:glycosyltransferase involved in cell wall biosynthesis